MAEAARRQAEGRGRRAETIAAWWLRAKGYRVLARRVRGPVGEIDLIVRRGATIAAVEVKTRRDLAAGLEAVTAHQRRRIERAFAGWLAGPAGQGALAGRAGTAVLRFDVVVIGAGRPRHLPGAWQVDERTVRRAGW